jgi:peptidoglycan-associated lipoprotein
MGPRISGIRIAAIVVAGGLSVSACATEDYVNQQVAGLGTRVAGDMAALNSRVDSVEATAAEAQRTANAAGALAASKSAAKFAYTNNGNGGSVTFDTNKWDLSPQAESALADLASKLTSDNKDVYLEIVGHGDPRGSVMANRTLGAKRALQVQRFLAGRGVALSRMDIVSWGEERVVDTKDRSPEALQQARRVDIVLKE